MSAIGPRPAPVMAHAQLPGETPESQIGLGRSDPIPQAQDQAQDQVLDQADDQGDDQADDQSEGQAPPVSDARTTMDLGFLELWGNLTLSALAQAREAIDALNVFPVPDGDTGTNMFLTMQSAVVTMRAAIGSTPTSVGSSSPPAGAETGVAGGDTNVGEGPLGIAEVGVENASDPAEAAALGSDPESPKSGTATAGAHGAGSGTTAVAALARGALLGARGNSGVILSELLRGLATVSLNTRGSPRDGHWLARALTAGSERAYAAVSHPKEGTVLTVARVASAAAQEAAVRTDGDLSAVAQAAVTAARVALANTTTQLEALRRAGVVDAGGQGYLLLLEALVEVISGVRRDLPEIVAPAVLPAQMPGPQDADEYGGPAYEVMFLLEASEAAVPTLRARLGELGDSVVVVGGEDLWNVHVHADDAGAAIEAGMSVGRPYRIRVTYLDVARRPAVSAVRALVVVTHGQGVTDLLEASGVTAVRAPLAGRPSTAEMLAGIVHSGAGQVILLPGDKDSLPVAETAAVAARAEGLRVAVIPTRSIVQSLSAVAVHDPAADFDDDVVAMTRAAASTHYAGLTTAIRSAMTSAGACQVGDELGVIGGEIAVVGSDVQAVARSVVDLMLSKGGEMVTIVLGEEAPADFMERLTRWGERCHPDVEFVGYEGGQPRWHAIIGVE